LFDNLKHVRHVFLVDMHTIDLEAVFLKAKWLESGV